MSASLGDIDYFEDAATTRLDTFSNQINQFLGAHGLRHYSFLQIYGGYGGPSLRDMNLHTNYETPWVRRYIENRYDQLDPVCQLARKARNPYLWGGHSFLRRFEKRQRKVFWEARDFGIQYGLSIPIRDMSGSIGLVSFTSESRTGIRDVLDAAGPTLHVAAHQISDRLTIRKKTETAEDNPLSPRERESLCWVAEGMTSEEIADRMRLSVSAVNYHLGNASRKLDARNRHHAALLALSRRLI